MSSWLPEDVKRRDAHEAVRSEIRGLSSNELGQRLRDVRSRLADCVALEGRGLGAFAAQDRERAEVELELIKEIQDANRFAARLEKRA